MATKTVWWDKNNDQHEGYIQNGLTYMDEAATTRVPVGATVQTAAGTYKMTSDGGIPTYATTRNQYAAQGHAAINAYKAAGQIQEQRINAATNAAIAEINRQKQQAETGREDADRAAREAYRAAANPFGALEEQRVRLGLDESGYAESSKLRLASDYAGQLRQNARAMNEQLQALDVKIAQARASGQYELANMMEARAQNIMQQQLSLQGNLFSGDMQAMGQAESVRQFDEQMALQREQMAAQQKQAADQNKYNLALTYIENGASAPFISEALGIPQTDVNTLIAAVKAQKAAAATVRSSGSGSGSGKKGDKGERTAFLNSLMPEITEYGDISGWLAEYGNAYKLDEEDRATLRTMWNASKVDYVSKFESVMTEVREMKTRGYRKERIVEYLDKRSDTELTDEGYRYVLEKFFPDER